MSAIDLVDDDGEIIAALQGDSKGNAFIRDDATTQIRSARYGDTIGYATGLTYIATWIQSENIRRYRIRPSADMRVVEDAVNVAQAEAWLNTGAAATASPTTQIKYWLAYADEWSEWKELDKNPAVDSLTNIYVGLNAAGTGATVQVEAE